MSVVSIRIDDNKHRALKVIATLEGKTIEAIISELIDDYVRKNKKKIDLISGKSALKEITTVSENSFREWDNDEDEIYNDL